MSRKRRVFTGLGFSLIAFAPLVIGVHDLVVAPDVPSKVLAFLLLLFGVAAVAPVYCVAPRTDATGGLPAVRLWASVAGMAAALTLLISQYTSGDHTEWVYAWWAMFGLSVIVLLVSLAAGGAKHFRGVKWTAIGAIAASTVVTGLVQFWYRSYYAPLRAQPNLVLASTLKRLAPSARGFIPLDAHVTIKNTSGIRVQVLASVYSVTGILAKPKDNSKKFPLRIQHGVGNSVERSSDARFAKLNTSFFQGGPVVPTGWFFERDEKYDTHFIIQVPAKSRYASVALNVQIAMAQGERLQLTNQSKPVECIGKQAPKLGLLGLPTPRSPECVLGPAVAARVTGWDIPRRTWLRKLTSAPRAALSAVIQADRNNQSRIPYVYELIDRTDKLKQPPTPETDRIERLYSLTYQESFYELNLKLNQRKVTKSKPNSN